MNLLPWQTDIWQEFTRRIAAGTMPHALLLHGPAGVGKRQLAQHLARRLLCLQPLQAEACGQCRSCQLSVPGGAHPDWILLAPAEDKTAILVDQIRELCSQLSLSAGFSGRRVGVIEAADSMNVNAANALLKTLEEPGADVHIILVADRLGRLPATIRSRCQPIFCPAPGAEQALSWLAAQDKPEAEAPPGPETLAQALQLAAGAPLLALEYIHQGVVGEAQRVGHDLFQLAQSNQPDPFAVWQGWQDIPAQRLWRWVLLSLHSWASKQQLSDPQQSHAGHHSGASLQTLSKAQVRAILQLSQAAQQALRLAATPVRDELQSWRWLLQWIETGPTQVNHGAT